jgi:nitrite reductase/ring-hydroxylating ferredoxin subunit
MQLSGVIGALIAAIPGAVDYFKTVPPKSSGKKRATQHALLNITNLVLFFIAWLLKGNNVNPYIILVMEITGLILLTIAGWLGGTLVYRNQIGVDARYANAGKWKEEYKDSQKPIEVAALDELKPNQMKLIHVGKKRIVIGRTEKGYVAFDDRCTHRGGSLAGGAMICATVQCPWHGSQFDVNTGFVKAGPSAFAH